MIIGRYEIPKGYSSATLAGLVILGSVAWGLAERQDNTSGSEASASAPTKSHTQEIIPDPAVTPNLPRCASKLGEILMYRKTPDLDIVKTITVEPAPGVDIACADVYNPSNAEKLTDVIPGTTMWACKETGSRLEVVIPAGIEGRIQGAINVTPDFKVQDGPLTNCKDVKDWQFTPGINTSNIPDYRDIINDTPYYDTDYDKSAPNYGKPENCEDVFGNINWQDAACAAQAQN
jgi:hypothetical protein